MMIFVKNSANILNISFHLESIQDPKKDIHMYIYAGIYLRLVDDSPNGNARSLLSTEEVIKTAKVL